LPLTSAGPASRPIRTGYSLAYLQGGKMKAAYLGTLMAATLLVARGVAASPEQVTVEFLSRRSESVFEARKSISSLHYILDTGGDIIVERRFRFMSDASLAQDLAYTGSRPFTRYVFLFVYTPEKTSSATITKAVDRLKAVVAKSVTGNGKVVIEVLPRDWFFVNELDEPEEAQEGQLPGGTELESNDTPEPVTDEGSNDTPEPAGDGDSDRNAKTLNRGRQLPAPSLQVAVAALRATRKDASMQDALNFWIVLASSFVEDRLAAAQPRQVTVEFLSKRSESTIAGRKDICPLRYTLETGGDIVAERRILPMTDTGLAKDLAYTGSRPFIRYVRLFVYTPDETSFATITKAVDRLKTIIAKNVTGNGKVVIEVLPRDWLFVSESDEPDEADLELTRDRTKLEPGAAEPVADGDSQAVAP
jgi:hypothetical protein